ncbi:hypothetical protein B0O80DRAFT_40861 [Mortierella sp. GBAus27b]|nr:hypothetical protein BGX31_002495 [Mortierella sp. GBA43]KAI8355331.1 hypothetical protein B0O80DRAFT_40861 [Mortierella sp. GBAus27b]
MSTPTSSVESHRASREFILQNTPHKDVKQLAQEFFEAFNLTSKSAALDALHASLNATNNHELKKLLKEDDFKKWATDYFKEKKSQRKMSLQNVVDKQRNNLQITGVLKGSAFISSGMDLLAPEASSPSPSPSLKRKPSTMDGESSRKRGTRDDEQTSPLGEPGPSESTTRVPAPSSPATEFTSVTGDDIQPGQTSPPGEPGPSESTTRVPAPSSPATEFTSVTGDDIQHEQPTPTSNRAQEGGELDKSPRHGPALVVGDNDNPTGATTPAYSTGRLLGSDLPSSDPVDMDFQDEDIIQPTTRLYAWNFLGPGRVDSGVDIHWVHNEIEVGRALMECRDRIVENNRGLEEPYEKLAVNFIFLIEAEFQTGGLQGDVEDQVWDSLCDATGDPVLPLSNEDLIEAHQWAHRLAQNKCEAFAQLLESSPPRSRTLKSILTKIADTTQLWNSQLRNEDTFLKYRLGPFLDTYFGKLQYTKSVWTTTQDDTRDSKASLLIPGYATTTVVGKQQVSVVLLEGKTARNRTWQIWDDLTKLGQKMKLELDSILKLEPEDDVCVVGILVREPLVEFYTMRIRAEATYIMHRFASAHVIADAMNAFSLVHLMEVFDHARSKVERTVNQLRRVKVHASQNPKVPLSWLRPSFKKPRLYQIDDGQ